MNKQIYVRDYPSHAGRWIYNGYASAWEHLGYDVHRWEKLNNNDPEGSSLMLAASDVTANMQVIDKALKYFVRYDSIYMFVGPNRFPEPYGSHPNFVDPVSGNYELVEKLNSLDNVVFWTFCDVELGKEHYHKWKKVHHIPLAFDSINYERIYDPDYEFDVCYVGGWADNGFDTKKKILKEYLGAFKDTDLNCGFFINQDISHEQECKILTNSKVCLNIHDEYQHKLKLDTNERTWKSLGLHGILISDDVGDSLPDYVYKCASPQAMVETAKEIIDDYPLVEKERNSAKVQKEHTYIERCKELEKISEQ